MSRPPLPESISKVQESLRKEGRPSQTYIETKWIVITRDGYSYFSEGSLEYVCQSGYDQKPWLANREDE